MVNPIPARKPVQIKCDHLNSSGSEHNPRVTPSKANKMIPRGLPINNPVIMPRLFVEIRSLKAFEGIKMAVLANANNGNIMKATGLWSKCCIVKDGDFSDSFLKGMAKATNTPVIVGCIPVLSRRIHKIIPKTI